MFVSESETVTSPPPITINSQRFTVQPSHESSPSPSAQRKKPIPLPRKKWPPPGSSRSSSPVPSPRSPVASKFVYCQQETQHPASLLATADFHIPHSASTSCLTSSADYSGDYSGGTGDSGVGDIKQQYPLSKKSLDGKCSVYVCVLTTQPIAPPPPPTHTHTHIFTVDFSSYLSF